MKSILKAHQHPSNQQKQSINKQKQSIKQNKQQERILSTPHPRHSSFRDINIT